MTTTTQATVTTTPTTTTTRNIWIKEWNEQAVFIEDRLDQHRPTWIPRTAITKTTFIRKRKIGKEVHFIYDANIDENWWKENVKYKGGVTFQGNNGHRRGYRSDD